MIRLLGYLWALPLSLVGLILGCLSLPMRVRIAGGAVEFTSRVPLPWIAAFTVGWVIVYDGTAHRGGQVPPWTPVHEREHVRQCLILGPLIVLAYPIASLVALVKGHWYFDNWFEVQARKKAQPYMKPWRPE